LGPLKVELDCALKSGKLRNLLWQVMVSIRHPDSASWGLPR